MRWSGKGLGQSLWVQQSCVTREGDHIERKLFFKPWLDLQAGEYTCNLDVQDNKSKYAAKKTFTVGGTYITIVWFMCIYSISFENHVRYT